MAHAWAATPSAEKTVARVDRRGLCAWPCWRSQRGRPARRLGLPPCRAKFRKFQSDFDFSFLPAHRKRLQRSSDCSTMTECSGNGSRSEAGRDKTLQARFGSDFKDINV